MSPVRKGPLLEGTEIDVGAAGATEDGYGRLTIRFNPEVGKYELYDLDNRSSVCESVDLEAVITRANELTPIELEYEEKPLMSYEDHKYDLPEAGGTDD